MIPQKGHYVKIMFRNGTQAEGYVESWSDQQSVLKSSDNSNLFLIQKTVEDVMAIKIILEKAPESQIVLEEKLEEYQQEFEQVYEQPSADDLRIKNLAQLKCAMIEQERKITASKLRQHIVGGNERKNSYEHGLFTKQSTK